MPCSEDVLLLYKTYDAYIATAARVSCHAVCPTAVNTYDTYTATTSAGRGMRASVPNINIPNLYGACLASRANYSSTILSACIEPGIFPLFLLRVVWCAGYVRSIVLFSRRRVHCVWHCMAESPCCICHVYLCLVSIASLVACVHRARLSVRRQHG